MITEITKAQLLAWRLGTLPMQVKLLRHKFQWLNEIMFIWPWKLHGKLARSMVAWDYNEYPIMRHMMNLETVLTYEGTHEFTVDHRAGYYRAKCLFLIKA
jgi:hypothetical protein